MDRFEATGRTWRRLLGPAFAVFLVMHGIAHFVGTSAAFSDAANGKTEDYLGGLWKLSDPALLRVVGVAWAVAGLAFLVVAWAVATRHPRRRALLVSVSVASLVLSTLGLWKAVIGVAIDIVLLLVAWEMRVRSPGRTAERRRPVVGARAA